MTETRKKTYLSLPVRVHQLARVGAAAEGVSMSEFIACIVLEDAVRRGVDEFVRAGEAERESDKEEHRHG